MTVEEALVDYLSRVIGTLVSEIQICKEWSDDETEKLIGIIQDGIDEVSSAYKIKKSELDSAIQT